MREGRTDVRVNEDSWGAIDPAYGEKYSFCLVVRDSAADTSRGIAKSRQFLQFRAGFQCSSAQLGLDLRRFAEAHGILHQLQSVVAFCGQDRLRMELHCLDRQLAMADAHDNPVLGLGGHLEAGGESLLAREEGMVTADLELLGKTFEDTGSAVPHRGWRS